MSVTRLQRVPLRFYQIWAVDAAADVWIARLAGPLVTPEDGLAGCSEPGPLRLVRNALLYHRDQCGVPVLLDADPERIAA